MLVLEVERKAMSQGMRVASQGGEIHKMNSLLEPLQSRGNLIWAQ